MKSIFAIYRHYYTRPRAWAGILVQVFILLSGFNGRMVGRSLVIGLLYAFVFFPSFVYLVDRGAKGHRE